MIDTAQAQEWYDESLVGQALARTNVQLSSIVVVTKVHPRSFAEDKLVASIQDSKKLLYPGHLNKQTLDVVLLHAPYCWRDHCSEEEESHDWKEAWFALEALKKSGDIAAIGVSNFDARLLRELLDIANVKVSVIQNWMDPFQQDNEVRELAATYDIAYMAYSSYGTQWEWKLHRNPVFTSKDLKAIAHKHHVSIARVVTSWVMQINCVAIPRTSNLDHLDDNFVQEPFLDADDMAAIVGLDGTLGPLW
jgi:diketogulonate reductase-like aldo/keto reductase